MGYTLVQILAYGNATDFLSCLCQTWLRLYLTYNVAYYHTPLISSKTIICVVSAASLFICFLFTGVVIVGSSIIRRLHQDLQQQNYVLRVTLPVLMMGHSGLQLQQVRSLVDSTLGEWTEPQLLGHARWRQLYWTTVFLGVDPGIGDGSRLYPGQISPYPACLVWHVAPYIMVLLALKSTGESLRRRNQRRARAWVLREGGYILQLRELLPIATRWGPSVCLPHEPGGGLNIYHIAK